MDAPHISRLTLTVYFEEPFWVGVFERIECDRLSAARVVFGAEPKGHDLLTLIWQHYHKLHFSPAVAVRTKEIRRNPKRMQRQAQKQTLASGIGTKSQQTLKMQQEQNKLVRKTRTREQKEAEKQRLFDLRQQKKREKHRGH